MEQYINLILSAFVKGTQKNICIVCADNKKAHTIFNNLCYVSLYTLKLDKNNFNFYIHSNILYHKKYGWIRILPVTKIFTKFVGMKYDICYVIGYIDKDSMNKVRSNSRLIEVWE